MPNQGNVLLLLNSSPQIWRAMEEFHFRLCQELAGQGRNPILVLANPIPTEIRLRLEASGAAVYFLAYRNRRRFAQGLRRLVREYSVSMVHIRFFRYYQFVAWLVRILGVKAIVLTDAESNELSATGLKRTLQRLRSKLTTEPVQRMIALSDYVRQRLIASGVPPAKIDVNYNGIDLDRFMPDPNGKRLLTERFRLAPNELILTTISRLSPVKCVDVLLRACKTLTDRGIKLRFFVVGQGGPLESQLRHLCQELGISSLVEWIGETAEPELYLRGSDIFLLASRGEAFGNVLVEAMACGTPVVGSRSGAIPEIVIDGECGYLAEPGNPNSFADAIESLFRNPDMRQQFSAAAIARAQEFSVERAVAGTLNIYRQLWLSDAR